MHLITDNHIQFFTTVFLNWLPLLKTPGCTDVIIRALKYRVQTRQVAIAGYVIMPNHLHLIWRIAAGLERKDFQPDFLKITAKQLIDIFTRTNPGVIQNLTVDLHDRQIQVWKRNSMSIDLFTEKFLLQKLNYVHYNPCQPHWRLANHPSDYLYSSARFYESGEDSFGLLKHYADI